MSTEVLLVEPKNRTKGPLAALRAPRLHAQADVQAAWARRSRAPLLWIAASEAALELILTELPHRPRPDQRLLVLNQLARDLHNLLHAHFRFVVSESHGVHLLPFAELAAVLNSEDRADLFIGGAVIELRSELLLYRGNLEPLTVPLSWFAARP